MPLLVVLTIIGLIVMRGNPFFTQERSGKSEKTFKLIKFRSMNNKKDRNGILLPDELRTTKYGKFLRSTSLDELPELFNIFIGDMAIVGPRPLPICYNSYMTKFEKERFKVRGGLIPPGGAMEHKAIITWEKQFEHECWYANNVSLYTDLRLIYSTISIVFQRSSSSYGEYVRLSLDKERTKNE